MLEKRRRARTRKRKTKKKKEDEGGALLRQVRLWAISFVW